MPERAPPLIARLARHDAHLSARLAAPWAAKGSARRAATIIAHSGDGALWVAFGVAAWILGAQGARHLVQRAGLGVLLAASSVGLIKRAVQRPRPRPAEQQAIPLWAAHDRHSFPSGHSARLLATAVTLGATHPRAGVALGLWSAVVGLARVALGAHYALDVVAGLATGALAGAVARYLLPARATRDSSGQATRYW